VIDESKHCSCSTFTVKRSAKSVLQHSIVSEFCVSHQTILNMKSSIVLVYFLRLAHAIVAIPEPSGPFNVGYNAMKLTDESRTDPYAPSPKPRAVMISAFYPVAKDRCKQVCPIRYMPPATAAFIDQQYASFGIPNGTFEQFRLQMCCDNSLADDYTRSPVIIFSPGLGNLRLSYSAMAQSVASLGYFVVTIDHPYDADIVEFPDGSAILSANFTINTTTLTQAINTRAHDANFVLSQLHNSSVVSQLVPGAKHGLLVHSVAMFGHSLGGATALATMELDERIKGGINLDGAFYGPEIDVGTDRHFLIFGRADHNRTSDTSWARTWPNLRGWKLGLLLRKSQHGTFSDLPLLAKVLGILPYLPPAVIDLIGTLDGSRALEIISTYVTTFVDFVLLGKPSELLQQTSARFPEVSFDDLVPRPAYLRSNTPTMLYEI
jgi:pimeloyl-ACP methyl ester carboxylesterase